MPIAPREEEAAKSKATAGTGKSLDIATILTRARGRTIQQREPLKEDNQKPKPKEKQKLRLRQRTKPTMRGETEAGVPEGLTQKEDRDKAPWTLPKSANSTSKDNARSHMRSVPSYTTLHAGGTNKRASARKARNVFSLIEELKEF